MASSINRLTIGGNTGVFALPFATCTDSDSTAIKTLSITGFPSTLEAGTAIVVKFTNANTASSPSLKINGSTAISICQYGTTAVGNTAETSWQAGASVPLVYDGTNWITASSLNSTIIDDDKLPGGSSSIYKAGDSWVATFANGQEVLISAASIYGKDGWELSSDQDLCTVYSDRVFGLNELYLGCLSNTITLYNFDGYHLGQDDQISELEASGTKLGTLQRANRTWSIVG